MNNERKESSYTEEDFQRDDELRRISATSALRYDREYTKRVLGEGVYTALSGLAAESQIRKRKQPISR